MLAVSGNQFTLNGQPFRILSGSMHYFRVLRACWRDRLEKMRLFGLNTVETYVAWNMHEPQPGEFHFEDGLDIVTFIETAAAVGLKVIVRPGPYICSEWDFGGLPYWLLKDPAMQVRCAYPPYLAAADRFFDALLPRLAPLMASRGGPIIAMQVENEYGSYGADKTYLQHLADGLRSHGVADFLFTSDGPRDAWLQSGTLPDVLKTVNFAFEAAEALDKLREYQPTGPLMVTEFWSGWFDHWGEPHHVSADGSASIERSVKTLDEILSCGASVNFYMFHGGTNFGFMNGANDEMGLYRADVTSYDYAAPLDEAGGFGPRFAAYRQVLGKYVDLPVLPPAPPPPSAAFGPVEITEAAGLFESLADLSRRHSSLTPLSMEMYDQDYGFLLYRTRVSGPRPQGIFQARQLHDRAQLFLDGQFHSVLERESGEEFATFDVPPQGVTLDLLVENMGRVNFGPALQDRKGILGGVTLADQFLFGWEVYPLPLSDLSRLKFTPVGAPRPHNNPTFYRGFFQVDHPVDTYLALPGWTKGVAWINGFNLGRYWARGPQQALYLPAPLLKQGLNELIIFELHGTESLKVDLRALPDLG